MDGSRINVGGGLVLWEGTYRDKDVYIMPFGDPTGVEEQVTGIHTGTAGLCRSWVSLGAAEARRSDRFAEKTRSPKHSPFHWRKNGSFANGCGAGVG